MNSQKKNKEYLKFLEEHKRLVGLADWTILLVSKPKKNNEDYSIADTCINEMEREATITLYKPFYSKTKEQQANILMHELVHGRICVFDIEMEIIKKRHEEMLANDLTRGFERINYGDYNTT